MNIKVILESNVRSCPVETGGEWAIPTLEIHINKRLSKRDKTLRLFHALIENTFACVSHDKVDDITNMFEEGYDQL